MSPSPAHDSHGFTADGIRASSPTAVANNAPTPSSHTRANVSKYARVGHVAVWYSAHPRERATTHAITAAASPIRRA